MDLMISLWCTVREMSNVRSWAVACYWRDDVCSRHVCLLRRGSVTHWRVDHSNIQDCSLNTSSHHSLSQTSSAAAWRTLPDVLRRCVSHRLSECQAAVVKSSPFSSGCSDRTTKHDVLFSQQIRSEIYRCASGCCKASINACCPRGLYLTVREMAHNNRRPAE